MRFIYKFKYNTFLQSIILFSFVCLSPLIYDMKADDSGWFIIAILYTAFQVFRQYKQTKYGKLLFKEIEVYLKLPKEERNNFQFSNDNFSIDYFTKYSKNTMKYLFNVKM